MIVKSTRSVLCIMRRGGCFFLVSSFLLFIATYHKLNIWPWSSSLPNRSTDNRLFRKSPQIWQPPYDWHGTIPIYDNFPRYVGLLCTVYCVTSFVGGVDLHANSICGSLNDEYAIGVNHVAHSSWLTPPRIQMFPKYRDTRVEEFGFDHAVPCQSPRGESLATSIGDGVWRTLGSSESFLDPSFGSSSLIGHEINACYDRYGRFGAYGLTKDRQSRLWNDWHEVDWGNLQEKCYHNNKHRFNSTKHDSTSTYSSTKSHMESKHINFVERTAVVIRCYQHTEWTQDVKRNIRAIIQELALYTSAQYAVFLLVEVKDKGIKIWNDSSAYDQAMHSIVPREFRNITVLWSMYQWHMQYPLIPEDLLGVHLSQWLPLQYFQKLYPEFSFFWNWEMDVRFTGHHYNLVSSVDAFTTSQPRKGLWERNARFYIPQKYGSYHQFRNSVQQRYTHNGNDSSIWGPHFPVNHPTNVQASWCSHLNITPPTPSPAEDDFEWGVGEQADFITFLPMFNPETTNYVYRDTFANYERVAHSSEIPRRTTIITLARISSRLLQLMEMENTTPPMHHMGSESWPHSLSLQYGLKAVSVPHAIYMEQDWPSEALDFIFNNGDHQSIVNNQSAEAKTGEGSGGPESTFGLDREHNWERSTWYYRNRFAERLYKRWLGWEVDGSGGRKWEDVNGEYCLPPMLLHPIKVVEEPGDMA